MQRIKDFIRNYFSIFSIVCFVLFFITVIVAVVCSNNSVFAEWLTTGISGFLRRALAHATSFLPFSLAEILIMLSPLALTVIIILACRAFSKKKKAVRFLITVLAVLSLVYTSYFYTLGVGYQRISIDKKLDYESEEITPNDLYQTLLILREELGEELPHISFDEDGSSFIDMTVREMSAKICAAYEIVDAEYPELAIGSFNSCAKPVILSRGMTSLDLLGVYTFFTGESNVNVHYPDYNLPFTIAHELAHQRGISRENEANFVAFLVCIRADDSYIRYSGYLNMLEYMASALSRSDKELMKQFNRGLDERIVGELRAYSEFYNENKNVLLGKISSFVNDTYLKSQGTGGVVSYGLVVKLGVAYYKG